MIVGLLIMTPEPTPGGNSLISGAGLRRVRICREWGDFNVPTASDPGDQELK